MECDDIPEYISNPRQLQLVLFTGLDIANNRTHAAVFACFTQNRTPDRPPLNIVMLTADHALNSNSKQHSAKAPKSPRGYIKVDWLSKYINDVPSVIVVFADLNWDHPSWNEKVTECESKISSLRSSIGNRGTRICVVLLQHGTSVTGDDPVAAERASKLCQSCQISQKQLFVFPLTDQLLGYVVRLEAAFHELAQGFYQHCLKLIRARSIPNSFANLIIRQQFKLAFISELLQDTHTALRHYKLAYQHCTECEIIDSEIYELRQVAGLLNYKICQLSFLHSAALEAISQQKRHVSLFFASFPGAYPSVQLASIEFALWKSKQCSLFAGLFEGAVVSTGLAAVSTQHPGIYLHAAADHCREANEQIVAMQASRASEGAHTIYPEPDPLIPPVPLTFYGQRPWRVLVDGGGLADPATEASARIALEIRSTPNHAHCLKLLFDAVDQYKKYKCARMQLHAMLVLAEEYTAVYNHEKALQIVSQVLWGCRREGFTLPIPALLSRAIVSAFYLADVKEFMSASVQMLNVSSLPCFHTIGGHIALNFDRVRNGLPPVSPLPSLILSDAQLLEYQQKWENVLSEIVFFTLNSPRLDSFVRARVAFLTTEECVYAGTHVLLQVSLCSLAPVSITFDSLEVGVSDRTSVLQDSDQKMFKFTTEKLTLERGVEKMFVFDVALQPIDFLEPKQLLASGLSLRLESLHSRVYGALEWDAKSFSIGRGDSLLRKSLLDASLGFTSITVNPRKALLHFEGDLMGDALLGEIANLNLNLISDEQSVSSADVKWSVEEEAESSSRPLLLLTADSQRATSDSRYLELVPCENGRKKANFTISYYTQSVGSLGIIVVASISVDGVTAQERLVIPIKSQPPFNIHSSLLTLNNERVDQPFTDTEIFIRADIEAMAAIVVGNMQWEAAPDIEIQGNERNIQCSEGEGEYCSEGDILTLCAPLRVLSSAPTNECQLGEVCIRWKRAESGSWVESRLSAGSVTPRHAPIAVSARVCTSKCVVRTPIGITFSIRSLHSEVIDLQITVKMADLFTFGGIKQVQIYLLPSESYECSITAMALSAGRHPFPTLQLRSSMFDEALLNEVIWMSVPASIFVLPLAKR